MKIASFPTRWRVSAGAILSVGGLLAVIQVGRLAGSYLICAQKPEPVNLILVLGGDFYGPRVVKAAELATQGYAPRVLISGPPYRDRPEGEFAVDFLASKGYSRRLFSVFEHDAHSTTDEVVLLCRELSRRDVKRAIFVTSAYHSRRVQIVFRLYCPGIYSLSVPAPPDITYRADRWWSDVNSRRIFLSEWRKIVGSVLFAYPLRRLRQWGRPDCFDAQGSRTHATGLKQTPRGNKGDRVPFSRKSGGAVEFS